MINQQRLFHKQSLFLHDMYASVFYTHRLFRTKTVIVLAVLVFCPDVLYSAELVKNWEISFCQSGQYVDGKCAEAKQGTCPDKYNDSLLSPNPFYDTNVSSCNSGYSVLTDIPVGAYFKVFSGGIVYNDWEITFCQSAQYVDGKCVEAKQGTCPDKYKDSLLGSNPFYDTNVSSCNSGYSVFGNVPAGGYLKVFSTGVIYDGWELSFCPSGQYVDGNCETLVQNDCPSGYSDSLIDSISTLNKGTCPSGYTIYSKEHLCGDSVDTTKCVITTEVCPYGTTQLKVKKTDNIIYSFPLFAQKHTVPSINIGFNDGQVCYIDLEAGSQSGAINIKYNNITYHTEY